MRADLRLAAIASLHGGYVTFEQAEAAGVSRNTLRRRVEDGTLLRVAKGLFLVPGVARDWQGLLRAAIAKLPDAVVSHQAAAQVLDIPHIPRDICSVTVHASTTHSFPAVVVHRVRDLADDHRTEVEGMPVTTVARTLVDLAAVCPDWMVASALDDTVVEGRVDIDEVVKVFEAVAGRGKPGVGALRSILAERVGDDHIPATRIEQVARKVFRAGGLPDPVWQYPAPWNPAERIDFAWPQCKVGCECDSRRWHTRVRDFENDRRRDRAALMVGWKVLRFTWEELTERPHEVVAQLRRVLAEGC